jgi:hypothetical protein
MLSKNQKQNEKKRFQTVITYATVDFPHIPTETRISTLKEIVSLTLDIYDKFSETVVK